MPKFQNQFNSHEFPDGRREKKSDKPSTTIPDQTMSIAEIMRRFASGQPVSGIRESIWNGEEDLPDLDKMDLAERQQYLEDNSQRITELNSKLKQQKAAAAKKSKKEEKTNDDETK